MATLFRHIWPRAGNTCREVTKMSKASTYFILNDVDGKHDTKELKRELDAFPRVISVSVNPEKNSLAVDYDTTGVKSEQLVKRLEKLGYQIEQQKTEEHVM